MGKTRNTGKLATQIQFDNSNNLVIGNSTSSSFNTSGSVNAIGGITGSIFGIGDPTSFSASISSDLVNLESKSASVDTTISNINSFTASNGNTSLNAATSSYSKLTGGNTFTGTQIVSASVYIQGDLVVQGSSSIQYISASSVSIGTNIVQLNTATPAVRFGGVSVQDSGSSAGVTGSMLWDSCCNRWIYSNPSGVGYSGGVLMSGPRASTFGNEPTLTRNYIAKSGGGDHLYDSCIIDDGTTVCVNANLKVTGTAYFSGTICTTGIGCFGELQVCAPGDPSISFYRNTCNNAVGIGRLYWYGADNVGTKTLYSYIQTAIEACGTNSYCSRIEFFTACNGTVARSFLVNGVGVGCFASQVCAPSFIGGTMSGTTIYGSTTICTPSLVACTTSAAAITIDGYSKLSFKDRGTEYGTINASRYNFGGESTMMSFQSGNCFLFLNGTNCLMFIGSNGDVGIGTTSTSTEANLFLGAKGAQEGGQMVLQKGTSCTCATHLDNYQNSFRIMSGTDTGSTTVNMSINHITGNACFLGRICAPLLTVSGDTSIAGTSGTITYFPSNPKSNALCTTLLGSMTTADLGYGPQFRFSGAISGEFIDIGQDKKGGFVVETTDTPRVTVTQGGNVGIGTIDPTNCSYPANGRLVVFGDESQPNLVISTNGTSAFGAVRFVNANGVIGSISMYSTSVTYNTTSDYRLKQDLKEYSGLNLISAIKTYDYQWKSDNKRAYGVLAHELQEVLPHAVFGEKDAQEMQGVDYSKLVPILIKGMQEQQCTINLLKSCAGIV